MISTGKTLPRGLRITPLSNNFLYINLPELLKKKRFASLYLNCTYSAFTTASLTNL